MRERKRSLSRVKKRGHKYRSLLTIMSAGYVMFILSKVSVTSCSIYHHPFMIHTLIVLHDQNKRGEKRKWWWFRKNKKKRWSSRDHDGGNELPWMTEWEFWSFQRVGNQILFTVNACTLILIRLHIPKKMCLPHPLFSPDQSFINMQRAWNDVFWMWLWMTEKMFYEDDEINGSVPVRLHDIRWNVSWSPGQSQ